MDFVFSVVPLTGVLLLGRLPALRGPAVVFNGAELLHGRSTVLGGSSRLRICLPSQESQFSIVLLHVSCRVNEEAPLCLTLS